MDSITWAAIALSLINGAGGKMGEMLSEGAITAARRLLSLLNRKSPQTVNRLTAAYTPNDESNVIDAEIIEEIRQVVENEPEMQATVDEIATAMSQQFGNVANFCMLAQKIGFVNQGTILTQRNEFSF